MCCLLRDNRKLELGLGSPISIYRLSSQDTRSFGGLLLSKLAGGPRARFGIVSHSGSLTDTLRSFGMRFELPTWRCRFGLVG